jgi:hypothetical protein
MGKTETILAVILSLIPIAVASECTLCGDESIPDFTLSHEQDGISCRSLFNELTYVQEGSQECSSIQLTAFQTGCCSEAYVPSKVCSLCPDGTPFRTGITVPGSPGRRELTCQDLSSEASFLDFFTAPGECSDTFLRRSAAWCECPGVEVECTLCPDGSRPPNPYKTENVLYGWDCASFEYVTALLSSAECPLSNELLEFDASAFCCPHVSPPPNVCSFCPNTQVLGDPEKLVHTGYGTRKCGDIENSLSLVPTESSCSFAKEQFHSDHCCVYPGKATSGSVLIVPQLLQIITIIAVAIALL